ISPLLQELLRERFFSALLPPSPEPIEENFVPIATITVNCKDGCRVVRVSNLERRRIVVTPPNLEYWFEALLRESTEFAVRRFAAMPNLALDLLDEASRGPEQVDAQFIYKKVGEILKELL